jgi:hypothetical protein
MNLALKAIRPTTTFLPGSSIGSKRVTETRRTLYYPTG